MNEPPREYVYALIELYPGGKVLVLGMYSTQELGLKAFAAQSENEDGPDIHLEEWKLDCRQSKFSVRVVACK